MAKKKNNQTVVNSIESVNLEVDTKKLAKAIVEAQEETKKAKNQHKSFRASFMASVNTMLFVALAAIAVITDVRMWIGFATNGTYALFDCILYTLMFAGVVIIAILCSVESWRDNDENAIQHFNTNVSLVALIIAIIALVRGVG